jgi:hypothetical protein
MTPRLFFVLPLALLAGCALQPQAPVTAAGPATPVSPAIAPASSTIEQLMAYLLQVKTLGAHALSEETSRMREAWGRDKSELARLKLALLLASSANTDDGELMTLLEPLVQDAASAKPEMRALATLVHGAAYERKRTKETLANAQARLREALKSQESNLARLDQQRRQIEDLEKKLNAFKTIEKSLIQRVDKPPR